MKMSSIGTTLLAFLAIATLLALVFMVGIRGLSGGRFKVTPNSFALTLLVPLLVGAAILGVLSFLEFHEEPVLCGDYCHSMEPMYESYEVPANNSLMTAHTDVEVTCLDCHTGPGVWGQVDVYFSVPNQVWKEMTGEYDLDDLGGEVPRENCLKCHDGEYALATGTVTTVVGTQVDPHMVEGHCVDCHSPHEPGIGLPEQTCSICHGTTMIYFDAYLEAHGERVGQDCMVCHDRAHPEDAQIPWKSVPEMIDRDFCSDCHPAVVRAYEGSATAFSLKLYGDCTDCHAEHNLSVPPHIVEEGWTDCTQCHVNFQHDTLMHNRTGVTYLGVPGVTDQFCANCHAGKASTMPSFHQTVECVSCHSDHRLRVVFDDCRSCHDDRIPTWHDETLGGCWNVDCHGDWFFHG